MKISNRQKIRVWYTVDPADMGYGNRPAPEILTGKPSFVGTIRQMIAWRDALRRDLGNCYQRWQYQIVSTGEYVTEWEMDYIVMDYLYN